MNLNKYLKKDQFKCTKIKNEIKYDEEVETLFKGVYGYKEVKQELVMIRKWFLNKENLSNQNVMLPKGIICYGPKGTGKSLLLKTYAESFGCPIYVINGEDNVKKEIKGTFDKARQDEMAIIFIDEIDYLCESNELKRILQDEFDGFDKNGRILILCTTNNIDDINYSMLRPGRIDRKFEINLPDKETREELFKKFISDLDLDDSNLNYEHIGYVCTRCSGAEIRAIINDAYLRVGNNLNDDVLEESYKRIVNEDYDAKETTYICKVVAVHETGHILMGIKFNNDFKFFGAKFSCNGGTTLLKPINEDYDSIKFRLENIMIALGGLVAEEIIFKSKDLGSYSDLSKANDLAKRLIERTCINSLNDFVAPYRDNENRMDTSTHRRKTEKLAQQVIRKCYRKTKAYLRKNKEKIINVSEHFLKEGCLTYKDLDFITQA